jgi:hypothetical protein
VLSDLSIFHDLQEGDHHEECLSFLNEQGSLIKAIGAGIPESMISASKLDQDFELHRPNSANRRMNVAWSPVRGQSSTTPRTKGFILQMKIAMGKVAHYCRGKAKNPGMVGGSDQPARSSDSPKDSDVFSLRTRMAPAHAPNFVQQRQVLLLN